MKSARSLGLRSVAVLALVAGVFTVGCGSDKPPVTAADASSDGAGLDDAAKQQKNPNQGNIVIGPKIAALCNLPTANFAFDSAALSPQAKEALGALAKCFVDGPAKGKGMRLVGYADPRGEIEYNFGLGQQRAGKVAEFIGAKGVASDKLETSSRGETEATGTDEAGWARDRKVEIFLAE